MLNSSKCAAIHFLSLSFPDLFLFHSRSPNTLVCCHTLYSISFPYLFLFHSRSPNTLVCCHTLFSISFPYLFLFHSRSPNTLVCCHTSPSSLFLFHSRSPNMLSRETLVSLLVAICLGLSTLLSICSIAYKFLYLICRSVSASPSKIHIHLLYAVNYPIAHNYGDNI